MADIAKSVVFEDDQNSTPKKRGGKPPHVPTEDSRDLVLRMLQDGKPQTEIADWLEIDKITLRKHYYDELASADDELTAQVKASLFQNATVHNNVSAQIFWMKARAGWSEKNRVELSGNLGVAPDLTKLTDDQLSQLRAIVVSSTGEPGND